MRFPLKFTLSIVLFIALLFVGFMYLMRGCLSKYDERSIDHKVLYFEKGNSKIIFAVVQFDKTTSYTQSGGFISKTVSTSYSVQNNDAVTGNKLNEKKIKDHREIKNHPVEIMGASGDRAWVFMNEPMVFDPFSLETIGSIATFEERNPSLKGKFPSEKRYYRFDDTDHNMYFTAIDGSAWMLDGKTFIASQQESTETGTAAQIKQLEKQLKENSRLQDTLMESGLRRPARQLAAKEIDLRSYKQFTEIFNQQRTVLSEKRDSLQKLKTVLEHNKRSADDLRSRMQTLKDNFHFSQAKVNGDTIEGKWFGLYSEQEMDELYERFAYQQAYGETARRQWFSSTYNQGKYGDYVIDKDKVSNGTCVERYLDGGFLVNNQTGKPTRLADGGYLVIYKNQVGSDGKIQLARVNDKGVMKWTFDTGLNEWADFVFTGKQLFVIARQNKELSGGECNILLLIDLENGRAEKYDYFEQKKLM